MKLRWMGKPSPHIIAYYGGFIHGNSYNIILEYADQGTLESFMRNTDPPSTIEDTLLFWDRLFDVTHGVMTIHGQIGNDSSASQILTGYVLCQIRYVSLLNLLPSGGIKTLNQPTFSYLVVTELHHMTVISRSQTWDSLISNPVPPNQMNPQTWTPLALVHMVTGNFKTAFSNVTDECLGAPETFRSHVDTESSPLQVTPDVDIWSIGCVLSEAAVWAHHGWKRVAEYRRQRSVEVETKGGGEGEHIFHYDGNLLDAVDNIHQDILKKTLASHHITRSVLDRLVNDMLQHGTRPQAKLVFEKSKRLIQEDVRRFGVLGLVGNTSDELIDVNEARIRTKTPPQIPPEHTRGPSESSSGRRDRSRVDRELPPGEPLLPDDDFAPSSSSSRSLSSPQRHHHEPKSQSSKRRHIAAEISQSGGQGSHVAPDPLSLPPTAVNTDESSRRQHEQQPQEEPVRPTLSIDEGHDWKKKKKNGESAGLPGFENLTSLDQRDHVSHVLSRLKLSNR